jgi:hypothetical protein
MNPVGGALARHVACEQATYPDRESEMWEGFYTPTG